MVVGSASGARRVPPGIVRCLWRRGGALAAGAALVALSGPLAVGAAQTADTPWATAGCADQWAMYQHDASHHGSAPCSVITPLTVAGLHPAWFFSTSQPVTASPTVVGGQVYVGDAGGTFYDIDAATGRARWSFSVRAPSYRCAQDATVAGDRHTPSYGEITSSAALASLPGQADPTVFFGGGGTLFALDAVNGQCRWAVDLDPQNPTSAMEVESSPVVFLRPADTSAPAGQGPAGEQATGTPPVPEVIVGSDSNESPGGSAPPGVQAFDADNGALLWKFEPENDTTVATLDSPSDTNGCGDVWSSPALDPLWVPPTPDPGGGAAGDGLVVATTGNCPLGRASPGVAEDPADCPYHPLLAPQDEGIVGIDATTGCLQWRWSEPDSLYTNPSFPDGGDTDIGSSPILATIGADRRKVVIDGSKSGYMYALEESSGSELWRSQPAQPGETGFFAGAIGGFIGSSALGAIDGLPTVFGATAIPAPFGGGGIETSGGPGGGPSVNLDTSLICVGGPPPAPDVEHCDPLRLASLHAVDATTGAVRWQGLVSLPSYGAVTTTNGIVFAPSTTGFSLVAYSADTGTPLWAFPTGAAMSSGAAIVGSSVFVGAGTALSSGPGATSLPPQNNGVWDFTLATP
jgi:outer membrane protein assembly factor BamB